MSKNSPPKTKSGSKQTALAPQAAAAFAPPIKVAYLDKPAHLRTRRERQAAGRALRVVCRREALAAYTPAADRRDAVQQLIDSSAGRIEHLVPIRYGGDCHLLNFGAFATPERRIIADINDFDETHPAPWEWELKRLAASYAIAEAKHRDATVVPDTLDDPLV